MTSNRKNAIINIALRSSSVIYLILLGVVLVPLYLKYISVELYGYWLATGNVISWIGDFVSVSAVMQQRIGVSYGAMDFKKISDYVASSLLISLLLVVALGLIFVALYVFIFDWLGITNHEYERQLAASLIFAGIGLLFTLFSFGLSGINYGLQLFKSVGFLNLGTNLTCIAATYFFLLTKGVVAFGLALFVRGVLDLLGNSIILLIALKKNSITPHFSWPVTKKLFGDVAFNFFSRVGSILSRNSQLFIIAKFVAPQAAVVFRVTKTIPEISKFFISVPAEAMMPVFSKYLGQGPSPEQVKHKISTMVNYTIWAVGLVFAGFVLLNKMFIDLWVGRELYGGNLTNLILVSWVIVTITTNSLMYIVIALGDLRKSNLMLFIQSVLFVGLMLALVKPFGIMGVALALLIAEITISLMYYPYSLSRYIKFSKKETGMFFRELVAAVLTAGAVYLIEFKIAELQSSWRLFLSLCALTVALYTTILFFTSPAFNNRVRQLFFKLFSVRFSK